MKRHLIAHVRKSDKTEQTLEKPLRTVSELTGRFARKIGLEETGEVLGRLHDLGKATDTFQRYIKSGEGLIDPDAEEYINPITSKGKIDHTTSGAQVVYEHLWSKGAKERIAAQVLALCIASHHSGLIDCLEPDGTDNFSRRLQKSDDKTRKTEALANLPALKNSLEDLLSNVVIEQITARLNSLCKVGDDSKETLAFKAGLLIRFLLSCTRLLDDSHGQLR